MNMKQLPMNLYDYILIEFIEAVISILLPKFVNAYPPTEDKINNIVIGFENEWKFIQVYGAIGKLVVRLTKRIVLLRRGTYGNPQRIKNVFARDW